MPIPLPVVTTPPNPRRFWTKVRSVVGKVPFVEDLIAAYYCAMDSNTPVYVRGVLFGAVAYFILPTDMVPDLLAMVGFTDDAAVLAAAFTAVGSHMRPEHRDRARKTLESWTQPSGSNAGG